MKRTFAILSLLMLLTLTATAQVSIGVVSYDNALKSMPEYAAVQKSIDDLRQQYDTEMKRSEEDFNAKYEDFLDNYDTYATSIRRKRQAELQAQLEANITFRSEAQRLLKQAESDALAPLREKLDGVLKAIAAQQGYIIIVNTDSNACPYITPAMSVDINEEVKTRLLTE